MDEQTYINIRACIDRALELIEKTRTSTNLQADDIFVKTIKTPLSDEDTNKIARTLVVANMMIQDRIEAIRIENYAMNEGEN